MTDAGIGGLVEPMVWNYNSTIMFPKGESSCTHDENDNKKSYK